MIAGELSINMSAGDSGFRNNIPDTADAPGASPRRCGAPFAMTSDYLRIRNEVAFPVKQGNPSRGMPTRRGQGPQERQTSPAKIAGSIVSRKTGNSPCISTEP
jgi:hypothetical protein